MIDLPEEAERRLVSLVITADEAETARRMAQGAVIQLERRIATLTENVRTRQRTVDDAKQVVLKTIAEMNEHAIGTDIDEKVDANKHPDSAAWAHAVRDLQDKRRALKKRTDELEPLARELASSEYELARQKSIAENAEQRRQGAQVLSGRCKQWLASQRGVSFVLAKPILVELNDGETLIEALKKLRKEIAEAQIRLNNTRAIRLTAASLKRQIPAMVSAMARAPNVKVGRDDKVQIDFNLLSQGGVPMSLFAWLMPGTLETALMELVDNLPQPERTLSADKKAAAIAEIENEILALERREESLCARIENEGGTISRRHDAHPLAILGMKIGVAARAVSSASAA